MYIKPKQESNIFLSKNSSKLNYCCPLSFYLVTLVLLVTSDLSLMLTTETLQVLWL